MGVDVSFASFLCAREKEEDSLFLYKEKIINNHAKRNYFRQIHTLDGHRTDRAGCPVPDELPKQGAPALLCSLAVSLPRLSRRKIRTV